MPTPTQQTDKLPSPSANIGLGGNKNFLLLFAAQVISLMGSGVTTVALALFAYDLAGGADATVIIGNALMLRIIAFLIFSQPAGVYADRVSRKRLLILMDLGRFILLGLFPFVTQVWQVYVLIFAINALTACFTPVFEATIPQIVGPTYYGQAVALSRVAVDVEAVLGPIVAGLLVTGLGVNWVFWFDGLTYLLSALLITFAAVPQLTSTVSHSHRSVFVDMFYGSRVLFKVRLLRQAMIASFSEATAGTAAIVATVAYVREDLQQRIWKVGLAMAAVGAGSSVGAFDLVRFSQSIDVTTRHTSQFAMHIILAGGLLLALVLMAAGVYAPYGLFVLLWAANGAGQAMIALPSSVLLAEHSSDHDRGRVYAAHFAVTHACWLITYPAIGYAAANWGTSTTFIVAGIACAISTLAAWVAGGPQTEMQVRSNTP